MNHWTHTILTVLIGGLVAAPPLYTAALYAQEQSGGVKKAGHHEMSAGELKEKLGLTDDQAAQLKAAIRARRDDLTPSRDTLRKDMKTLRDQIRDKAGDQDVQATLDRLVQDRKALHAAMETANETFKASTNFLTPTQRGKIQLWMMKHMHNAKGPGQFHEEE